MVFSGGAIALRSKEAQQRQAMGLKQNTTLVESP